MLLSSAEAVRQSCGLKLYGPPQEQSGKAGHATMIGPAWKWLNSPGPARERDHAGQSRKIEHDMPERCLACLDAVIETATHPGPYGPE